MKKKVLEKLAALCLIGTMIVGVVGCGQTETSSSINDEAEKEANTSAQTEASES